ncbi:MAG: division/cell wall cluster transcriptional repressor MraZ [candidate division NC10 bacterium]|jgi:MraZ protein
MFIGRFQHTIDPKGRVSIPARYRNALAQYERNDVIVVPESSCLNVYPFEAWERVVGAINEQSRFDDQIRRLGRLWISRAKEVELDGAGRVLLPPDSRQQAGLVKDVTLVGIGRDFFEIWDRARFEEYERTNRDELPSSFERLSQLGVK